MNLTDLITPYLTNIGQRYGCVVDASLCSFDKTLTPLSTAFIIASIAFFTISSYFFVKRFHHKIRDIFILLAGIVIFELFTAPLWNSLHLGKFGYIYIDLSWVLTIAWAAAFMASIMTIDRLLGKQKLKVKYFAYLAPMLIFTIAGEMILTSIGVRTYAPEVISTSLGWFFTIPVEVFYYAPVFSALVIAFFLFWKEVANGRPFVPTKRRFSLQNFIVFFVGIVAYELLVEPLALNQHFPAWSYVYLDISIIRILVWMLIIWLSTWTLDFLVHSVNYFWRFILYISLSSLILYQVESWMITNQYRVYSESVVQNFTGFVTPFSGIPIEIAIAIPLYLMIVLSFVAFWRMTLDNNL